MEDRYFLLLLTIVTVYLLVGAAVFQTLEQEKDAEMRTDIRSNIDRFLNEHQWVNKSSLEHLIKTTTKSCDVTKRMMNDDKNTIWNFMGSLMFATTVVTTIGYGHLVPESDLGKIVCVFYALIGIPLTLLLLNEVSKKLHRLSLRISHVNFCSNRPGANRLSGCLIICFLGIIVMIFIPAAIFSVVEQWSFIEGLYCCFITLSTIGFGDYIPCVFTPADKNTVLFHLYKLLLFSWTLFGLAYLALVIRHITEALAEYIYTVEDGSREAIEKEIARLYEKIERCRGRLLDCPDKVDCEDKTCKVKSSKSSILRMFTWREVQSEIPASESASVTPVRVTSKSLTVSTELT